jgi:hypothetical protein
MKALQQGWTDWRSKRSGLHEIQDHTSRSTTKNFEYKYPQVGKTGVDAVHEKLPTDGLYHEKEL